MELFQNLMFCVQAPTFLSPELFQKPIVKLKPPLSNEGMCPPVKRPTTNLNAWRRLCMAANGLGLGAVGELENVSPNRCSLKN